VGRHRLASLMKSDEFILELAPQVCDGFFALEVGKHVVGEKQPCMCSGHGAAKARQKVELPEHPGEGGFAALVRTRDDKQTFGPTQMEAVQNDRGLLCGQLQGQCEIEAR